MVAIATLVGLVVASIVPLTPAAATGGVPLTLTEIWKATLPLNQYASSVVYQGPSLGTLIVPTALNLTGYDMQTGAQQWSIPLETTFGLSRANLYAINSNLDTGNVVFLVYGTNANSSYASLLFAVTEGGSIAWVLSQPASVYWQDCQSNNQYAVCPGESNQVVAVDIHDGSVVSNTVLPAMMDIFAVVGTTVVMQNPNTTTCPCNGAPTSFVSYNIVTMEQTGCECSLGDWETYNVVTSSESFLVTGVLPIGVAVYVYDAASLRERQSIMLSSSVPGSTSPFVGACGGHAIVALADQVLVLNATTGDVLNTVNYTAASSGSSIQISCSLVGAVLLLSSQVGGSPYLQAIDVLSGVVLLSNYEVPTWSDDLNVLGMLKVNSSTYLAYGLADSTLEGWAVLPLSCSAACSASVCMELPCGGGSHQPPLACYAGTMKGMCAASVAAFAACDACCDMSKCGGCESACGASQCAGSLCGGSTPYMCTAGSLQGACSANATLWPAVPQCGTCCDASKCT